jgi:hypothetical protein
MTRGVARLVVCTALVVLTATLVAFAHPTTAARGALSDVEGQGATSISGVVSDAAGGVVPGATVVITNAAGPTTSITNSPVKVDRRSRDSVSVAS